MSTTDRIHPSHISIPLPISCNSCNDSPPLIFYSAPSSPFDEDDIPFYTPPIIPDDIFYFPQPSISSSSVPLPPPISQPPSILIHVPSSPPSVDARHLSSSTDDTFPTVPIPLPDFALDDEGLTTLEKLYLFSYSEAVFHRFFIVHAMPCFLSELTPAEAVTYVLPLLSGLAVDQDESVKEALAEELVPIIWWFLTNCQLTASDVVVVGPDLSSPIALISVQAFTPILGNLLLSPNATVGSAARYAVVSLLLRLRRADIREGLIPAGPLAPLTSQHEREMDDGARERDEQDIRNGVGRFGSVERRLFEHEILYQLVIGMGHLDEDEFGSIFAMDDDAHEDLKRDWPMDASEEGSTDLSSSVHMDTSDAESDVEHAAVGRLSSMSLMAAVTASGSLGDDAKRSFVTEIERVSRDQVWFVRREAAFALGALAKVVPEEIVLSSLASARFCFLLPIFESFRDDSVWNVRHSALFALPAILPRLPMKQRRVLALESIVPLTADGSPKVYTGVFEALGEVIYSFYRDPEGPPEELVRIFLSRDSSRRWLEGDDRDSTTRTGVEGVHPVVTQRGEANDEDSSRAHICAFNFPAVALTLGRVRWEELRDTYLELAVVQEMKVRRTLAASLGELARIIGAENARRDLVGVWRDALRCGDGEVRMRAVGCVELFVSTLRGVAGLGLGPEEDISAALGAVRDLLVAWQAGCFGGWRERESITKALGKLAELVGHEEPGLFRSLLKMALEDSVAAVRDAAVSVVLPLWKLFIDQQDVLEDLLRDIRDLAMSSSYRRRMTFIACQHLLVVPDKYGRSIYVPDDDFWRTITLLADDVTLGVRIGVARLVGVLCDAFLRQSQPVTGVLLDLVRHLSLDSAQDVRLYIPELFEGSEGHPYSTVLSGHHGEYPASFAISRPPPLSIAASSGYGHTVAVMQSVPGDRTKGGLTEGKSRRIPEMSYDEPRQRLIGPDTDGVRSGGVRQQVRVPV